MSLELDLMTPRQNAYRAFHGLIIELCNLPAETILRPQIEGHICATIDALIAAAKEEAQEPDGRTTTATPARKKCGD